MNAEEWLSRHGHRLEDSPYEKMFVRAVLARVPDLDFSALSAQYDFKDDDGKPRRCDFVIREGEGVRIAIEVDGFDKVGRGGGMTHHEFLDWQRRQASLTAQGWRVLRFANSDVKNRPARCVGPIDLLLRDERSKETHARGLQRRIHELERKVAEERAPYGDAVGSGGAELKRLKAELERARNAVALTGDERGELDAALRRAESLEKETDIMKTTIWALTALMGLLLVLFFLSRSPTNEEAQPALPAPGSQATAPAEQEIPRSDSSLPQAKQPAQTPPPSRAILAGSSCAEPLPWSAASENVGKVVAIAGPVARVAVRDDVRGKPVFITVGRAFPSRQRVDLVIWEGQRREFATVLEQELEGREVCVFGDVTEREGIPQIVLRSRHELQLR